MLEILSINHKSEKLESIINRTNLPTVEITKSVEKILLNVKENGDEAVRRYSLIYDEVKLKSFEVSEDEFNEALEQTDENLVNALIEAKKNIETYHEKQLQDGYKINEKNSYVQQIINPIERVGVYIPGGKAAYPSTVLMNVIPAKIAGVNEIVIVTPPNKEGKIKPSILVAAKLAGVTKVLKIGGAQAIGALAYGTETIEKVDKIVGPGNIYVALAKKSVSGIVGIDMVAGPTEVVILADETANPRFIAADLMAQAEHDEMASSIVITNTEEFAQKIQQEIPNLLEEQPRKEIIKSSFENYGAIIVVKTIEEGIELVNKLAPEHLELMIKNPESIVHKVKNAGAIFLGDYTPEPVGDYFAGTNHTLPTSGTARFTSPLNVNDFSKKTSVVYYNKVALSEARKHIELIAEEEGLYGHGKAISIRFEEDSK
ncbi:MULTISPECIES: histidinol dehydrogenase [Bacillaceae]|uniref:Histidinol dehydrogenase n=1 Tax=Gottfriedia luciferensis TaxID=178774 RepID=A0ABX2ZNA2_9BACI|nr:MULTISPECIES: histidinol dehydrogenase [Bacillaceae]ODG91093.1 histidinol dehydrogenase [Gottfriedia luciferensis]PGZ90821.1 histidinol dehydrogenase [Bacillus sp. AFS029533]SFC80443.1 histidinol dehydrogenase [Bacillus sp. UNCCL81]